MIAVVDIEITSQNPTMPLYPMRAFQNSPSSIRVRNVPKKIGKWQITSIQFVATYPDNTTKTSNCVLVGGVWVGTISGSSMSGYVENGYTIFASGTDENGNAVSNYILGKGDISILESDGQLHPGADIKYVHMTEGEPNAPRDGDIWQISGSWYIYQDGQAWPIGDNSGLVNQLSAEISTKLAIADFNDFKTNELTAYALSTDVDATLSVKADKRIATQSYTSVTLPDIWYDDATGSETNTGVVSGDYIVWPGAVTIRWNLSTHELIYDGAETVSLGTFSAEDMPGGQAIDLVIDDIPYEIIVYGVKSYSVPATVYADVVYLEGGAAALSTSMLTPVQISAVNSVVDSRTTVIDFGGGDISAFNWVGTIDCPLLVSVGLMPEGSGTTAPPQWSKAPRAVKIGEGVTALGDYVFFGCFGLSAATLPQSLTAIDNQAFFDCTALEKIDIPAGVVSIGNSAFGSCAHLSSVILHEGLRQIGDGCFTFDGALHEITIPRSISDIGLGAFQVGDLSSMVFRDKTAAEVSSMSNYHWGVAVSAITTWHDASQEWADAQNYATTAYAVHNLSGVANMTSMPLSSYEEISATADAETLYVITED